MRIHHHVSILLFVAIAGAIGLALAVGLFLGGLERAARASGKASEQYLQIEMLVEEARELKGTIGTLSPASSTDAITVVDRAIEGRRSDLTRFRYTVLLDDDRVVKEAIGILDRMMAGARILARDDAVDPEALATLQEYAADYLRLLEQVEGSAALASTGQDQALGRRRKLIMLVIGLICIAYLAVIERVRQWTTRRLIHPVQRLADAAIQAMEGEQFPGLEQGSTEELNTLARVLASFVDTLKAKVRERTAEVERQKERLEREVAVRRRAEDQLRHAAFHDKLTGLCNRDLLLDRLERCMQRARRHPEYNFAVLFLDIDRFKEVNDSLGHFVGDQLLIAVAERLHQCLRSSDSLSRVESNTIARIGGDEFVVLLDGIKVRADASVVAERVQEELSDPFRMHGHEVFITASIGIAFNELECEKADHLLRDADTAMYYAKAAGKARHEVFNKQMHDQAMARLRLGNDLRRAVEKQEFGRLTGFEALARWKHPTRGQISPVEFIARAEETGLIVQIGQWILERACRQLRDWQNEIGDDLPLSVSVNVSKRQVAEPGLVDTVQAILRETGLKGSQLKLEITESVIMENPDSIAEVLERLKGLGVHVHMDDFGTGYSSLSYLHRFPLDVLKIDRAFIGTMSEDDDYADVIHTVVAMAHTLNMQVTVEGVETHEQLAQLMALDCDYAQGYYFSKPIPAEKVRAIIANEPEWLKAA
jgi:diguanylate cyclase (GGDEF)-like protein